MVELFHPVLDARMNASECVCAIGIIDDVAPGERGARTAICVVYCIYVLCVAFLLDCLLLFGYRKVRKELDVRRCSVAIRCSNCGHELPREDARFCSYCGTYNAPQPQAQSQPAAPPAPGGNQPATPVSQPSQPPVRPTQFARSQDANATPWFGLEDQRPSSAGTAISPSNPSSSNNPSNPGFPDIPSTPRPVAGQRPRMRKYNAARDNSPWSEGAGAEEARDGAGSSPAQAAASWPGPLTHVAAEEQPQQKAAQASFPALPDTPRPAVEPRQAFNVRVWQDGNDQDAASPTQNVEDVSTVAWQNEPVAQPEQKDTSKGIPIEDLPTSTFQVDQTAPAQNKNAAIEDLPTSALKTEHPDKKAPAIDIVRGNSRTGQPDRAEPPEQPARFRPPVAPAAAPQAFSEPTIVSRPFPAAAASPPRVSPSPVPSVAQGPSSQPYSQGPSSQPYFQSAAPGQSFAQGTSAVQPPAAPVQPAMRSMPVGSSKRTILLAVLAFLVVVVIAIGAWIFTAKPFNVPPETQPLQTAANSTLGVTLQDPTGWLASTSGTTWTLSDSSKTDQVLLTQAAAPATSDLTATLTQDAKQLGMSSPKVGAPVTFGNSTWFQVQGGILNQGASYTGIIYTTLHNGHLYTLTMMAPQSTFADVERVIFTPMRSSLAFQ